MTAIDDDRPDLTDDRLRAVSVVNADGKPYDVYNYNMGNDRLAAARVETDDHLNTLSMTEEETQVVKDALRHERLRAAYNAEDRRERAADDWRDFYDREREKIDRIDAVLSLIAVARGVDPPPPPGFRF